MDALTTSASYQNNAFMVSMFCKRTNIFSATFVASKTKHVHLTILSFYSRNFIQNGYRPFGMYIVYLIFSNNCRLSDCIFILIEHLLQILLFIFRKRILNRLIHVITQLIVIQDVFWLFGYPEQASKFQQIIHGFLVTIKLQNFINQDSFQFDQIMYFWYWFVNYVHVLINRFLFIIFFFFIISLKQMQIYQNEEEDRYTDFFQNESSVLKIQNLQIALERAIQDISTLQKNLSFVISIKQQLEKQLQIRDKKDQLMLRQYERQLSKKNNELQCLKQQQQQLSQILNDTKEALINRETTINQHEQEKRRFQRIITDNKYTIGMLQDQLLAAKFSQDLSYQSVTFDYEKVQEIEKENDKLRLEISQLKHQYQKESMQNKKNKKKNQQFKNWLGGLFNKKKVTQGCEKVLMDQIQSIITEMRN